MRGLFRTAWTGILLLAASPPGALAVGGAPASKTPAPASKTPAPAVRDHAPPVPPDSANPDTIFLPAAPGLAPLTLSAAKAAPRVHVPLRRVLAALRRPGMCRTVWFGIYDRKRKVGWYSSGFAFRQTAHGEVFESHFTIQFHNGRERRTKLKRYATQGHGELLRMEVHDHSLNRDTDTVVERRGDAWQVTVHDSEGGAPRVSTLPAVKETLETGLLAITALFREGRLKLGAPVRGVMLESSLKVESEEFALQLLGQGTWSTGGRSYRVWREEVLNLKSGHRVTMLSDALTRDLRGWFPGRGVRWRRETEAQAKQGIGSPRPRVPRAVTWLAHNGLVILLIVAVLAVGLPFLVILIFRRRREG